MGYDADQRVMEIEFSSGRIYRYLEVPPELFAWLKRAPGKGALFNRLVEGKFSFERVDVAGTEPADLEDALRASLQAGPANTSTTEDPGT